MTYSESVEWLDSLSRFGINPGLERVSALCAELSDPQKDVGYIHVAGTNGKGSVSCMLSSVLSSGGYTTGMFTSPFTVSVREQLQVNGEYISENDFAALFTTVRRAAEKLYKKNIVPTMFETLCAGAFLYFKIRSCDYAVVECGMGGRLDSTNVIPKPLLCVFTSISLDHTAFLGGDITAIAKEKSGIIKPGCITVSCPYESAPIEVIPQSQEAVTVLSKACEENDSPLFFADTKGAKILHRDMFSSDIASPFGNIHIPFGGTHQISNALTVLECVRQLQKYGVRISDESIASGISSARMPARLEKLSESPLVILDGGHNPGCARAVADNIKSFIGGRRLTVLAAMMADKDFDSSFGIILPLSSHAVFTTPKNPRALDAEKMYRMALPYCKSAEYAFDSKDALSLALKSTRDDGVLLICGSFYLAAELRDYFIK